MFGVQEIGLHFGQFGHIIIDSAQGSYDRHGCMAGRLHDPSLVAEAADRGVVNPFPVAAPLLCIADAFLMTGMRHIHRHRTYILYRAIHRTDTQNAAIYIARPMAQKDGVELVISRPNGQIREKDSHGKDPYPPKGLESSSRPPIWWSFSFPSRGKSCCDRSGRQLQGWSDQGGVPNFLGAVPCGGRFAPV
jgi:hypothetical protein